jgi:mannose-6-phosphate isomerase-like protein (cupin superfamily)
VLPIPGHVTAEAEAESRSDAGDTVTTRVTIDPSFGCRDLEQRIVRFAPGRSNPRGGGGREELLFVVSGTGSLLLDGEAHLLEPETGAYVAPGARYEIENAGPDDLVLVSVLALEPGGGRPARDRPRATVRLADQKAFPAGRDREFRFGVDAETVTQFVGSIPPGRALPHYHEYEEVAYVLAGEGMLHIGGERTRVEPGSCIHFPPREPHILENVGGDTLRVLGVFHPAGDPSAAHNIAESEWEEKQ